MKLRMDRAGKVISQSERPMADSKYPPPNDLSEEDRLIWIEVTSSIPVYMFRATTARMLRSFLRAQGLLKEAVEALERDGFTRDGINFYRGMVGTVMALEKSLGISVSQLNLFAQRERITQAQEKAIHDAAVAKSRGKAPDAGGDQQNGRESDINQSQQHSRESMLFGEDAA